ncbi:murein hydrolase activator EnvC family protein [Ferruginibacter yonginensis]|uniref:Murein hydrolase activator EnvC family protein n=1 Tax=Ferruginibacter yonginensis TaxID=1310416 RepID=A0ABV8QTE7_9BACT
MMRVFLSIMFCCLFVASTQAQANTQELERQRQQLKKEIDEAQKLLDKNKQATQQSLSGYYMISNKVNLQDRLLNVIEKDLHLLDDNIYTIQKDINKYDRLLDTLKQEYAKSMVYAYKNRGNYEFLNFIFSADNFNDAIKRIAYLKSYRTFREMQGQNILRTQELRRKKLEDLGVSKKKKSLTLDEQNKELEELAKQKNEQSKIVAQLKKEGKSLNASIAAKQKQMKKVNDAVKAAIAKAIKDENDRRIAEEKRLKKIADEVARLKKVEDAKNATATNVEPKKTDVVKTKTPIKEPTVKTAPATSDFNTENVALNASFERNRGSLPWPVDNGSVLFHYGPNKYESGTTWINEGVTIATSIGAPVKAVFQGTVILVAEPEDGKYMVTVKHGNYFTSYVNLTGLTVKTNQEVTTGQVLGRAAANLDGIGAIDFKSAKGYTDLDPEKWLRRR